ncbi:MAG: ABC transporter permease, partial [Gemmatimonadetes bacterium]|nr:ABC transporter permease [Gemmatimonadota bacterium]
GSVVMWKLALALHAAFVTSLPPAVQAARSEILGALRSGAREGTYQRSRVRTALVLLQATLSVVLLVGAGLFVLSLRNVQTMDMGFDAERVLMLEWDFSNVNYTRAEREVLHQDALERVRALPSVERAAIGIAVPFWSSISTELSVPGRDSLPRSTDGGPYYNGVTPDYFETVGTRIVRGRAFTDADGLGAPRVAILSETMARMFWPNEDALGKCMRVGADTVPCSEIVGIAEDARRQSLEDVPVMQYYVPLAQRQVTASLRVLFIRPRGDAAAAIGVVRRELATLRSDLPFAEIRTLASLVDPHVRPWRLGAALFTAFGALALMLAALGLYAVIAYAVAQRTQEVGVRVALGARSADVARLVLSQSMRVVLAGIMIGLAIALAAGSAVQPLLFRQSARDPAVLVGVALVLLMIGLAAGIVPLRRALRIDPISALRQD